MFTKSDIGCYADGVFGHQHVREVLADLYERSCVSEPEVVESLHGEMPDDAWDEDEAIDRLNETVEEGLCFEFRDGDLVLVEVDDS